MDIYEGKSHNSPSLSSNYFRIKKTPVGTIHKLALQRVETYLG